MAKPLVEWLEKKSKFEWGESVQEVFNHIKDVISKIEFLFHPSVYYAITELEALAFVWSLKKWFMKNSVLLKSASLALSWDYYIYTLPQNPFSVKLRVDCTVNEYIIIINL